MKNEKYLLAEKEYHENHNEKYYEIPEGFWVLYEEFEAYYLEYQELYFHYYDDLLCYALMYNNISLYPPISIYHIIYFVRRKNEIIGYANKIENKQQLSINEKVLLMCFNNIYRFDYAFKNYKYYIKGNGGGNIFSFLRFLCLNIGIIFKAGQMNRKSSALIYHTADFYKASGLSDNTVNHCQA